MEQIIRNIFAYENIATCDLVEKAESGFSSQVYFIDDTFVIKLVKENEDLSKIKKEISFYKHLNFEFMPKYVASGILQGYQYLIISKINGESLYSIWHLIGDFERENIIKQIALILKTFNKSDWSYLEENFVFKNWKDKILGNLFQDFKNLELLGFETENLKNIADNLKIFDENVFGLVYNDAHFDNFIYKDGKVYLIDFDRVVYCSIDYEMLIFKTMCDNPKKFASKTEEKFIFKKDYKKVFDWFKHYYPEMFCSQYVEQKIKVYQYDYLVSHAIKTKNLKLIQKQNDILLNLMKKVKSKH